MVTKTIREKKINWHTMAVLGFKYGNECSYDRYMQFIIRRMNLLTVHQTIKQITNENKNHIELHASKYGGFTNLS